MNLEEVLDNGLTIMITTVVKGCTRHITCENYTTVPSSNGIIILADDGNDYEIAVNDYVYNEVDEEWQLNDDTIPEYITLMED